MKTLPQRYLESDKCSLPNISNLSAAFLSFARSVLEGEPMVMREQRPNVPVLAARSADIAMTACVSPAICDSEDARPGNNPEQKRERSRAKKKDELTAAAEILKATFDNLRQGFLVLDDRWRITSFNDRICELFGYPPYVVRLGATIYDL